MNNKTIVALLAVALVVSLTGTIMSVSEISKVGGQWMVISGAVTSSATDTGNTTLEILANVGLVVEDNAVDFGSGYVNSTTSFARIDSRGSTPEENWLNETGSLHDISDSMLLNNTGSTVVNLTIQQNSGYEDAEHWLCGDTDSSATCPSDYAKLEVRINEPSGDSCIGGELGGWVTMMNSTDDRGARLLCNDFIPNDGVDSLEIFFRTSIPQEAPTGTLPLVVLYSVEAK